jgi:hypothetical protein
MAKMRLVGMREIGSSQDKSDFLGSVGAATQVRVVLSLSGFGLVS